MVTLYSTGCPNCQILKKKLDQLGVTYQIETSIDEMTALGISKVPVLSVDEQLLNFNEALKWAKNQQRRKNEK